MINNTLIQNSWSTKICVQFSLVHNFFNPFWVKIMGSKRSKIQKSFGSKKILSPKKSWVEKNFGYKELFHLKKIGPYNDLESKKFWSKKMYPKISALKKLFWLPSDWQFLVDGWVGSFIKEIMPYCSSKLQTCLIFFLSN